LRHNSAIFDKFINTLLHNILCLSQLSESEVIHIRLKKNQAFNVFDQQTCSCA